MNNESKGSSRNRRCLIQARRGQAAISSRGGKHNSSLDHRDDHSANHRSSKERMTKQASNTHFRPFMLEYNIHSPLLGVSKISQNGNNKENIFKQDEGLRTLNRGQKGKKKADSSPFAKREHERELQPSISSTTQHLEETAKVDYRDKFYGLKTEHNLQRNFMPENIWACRFQCHYCPNEIAYYLQDCRGEENILCCGECGTKLKAQGYQLDDIGHVRSSRSHELDALLQKLFKASATLTKCLDNIKEHERVMVSELNSQLGQHDDYYDSLLEVILNRKRETHTLISASIGRAVSSFSETRSRLYTKKLQLEQCKQKVLLDRDSIARWTDKELQSYIRNSEAKIPSEENIAQFSVESWKVSVGDVGDFEKEVEKYLVKIKENGEKLQHSGNKRPDKSASDNVCETTVPQESFIQLACEEEMEWNAKPMLKKVENPKKEVYFSFERQNSIIYENSEEYVSSPGFKKI